MEIRKVTAWFETMPPRCTGLMLNNTGVDHSITSTDDIMFGDDAYTRIVRIALMDGEQRVSEVAAFTRATDSTLPEIVEGVQGWAFIVSLDAGQSGLDSLISLTKADRRLVMERLVRSGIRCNGTTSYTIGLSRAECVGEIVIGKDMSIIYCAKVIG